MKRTIATAVLICSGVCAMGAGATGAEAHYDVTWKPGAEAHMGMQTCAAIQFAPRSDFTGYDIEAWNLDVRKGGFGCAAARRVVRKVVRDQPGVAHWQCRHRVHNQGLIHSDYRCRDGHRLIVWAQS